MTASTKKIPLWLKLAYTAFLAVLVPVYWKNYGLGNFLFFCDIALFLTLIGIWTESALCISMACVGILLPQALWCADFLVEMCGGQLVGMTTYMFNPEKPLFTRGLSLFHGWLPFLLIYLVRRTGYAGRGLWAWTGLGWGACLISYLFLHAPTPEVIFDAKNVNFVFGMSEEVAQSWMHPHVYFVVWILALFAVVYVPTHLALKKWVRASV